ncbi:hypothetical protein BZA77DRAFT_326080 [Pyronema omphalodes]|nr:hypothetical protein BZA77DRAFT_326080 [Pyronema omphalodes]
MQYPHNNSEYYTPLGSSSASRNNRGTAYTTHGYDHSNIDIPQIRYDNTHARTTPMIVATNYTVPPHQISQHARRNDVTTVTENPAATQMRNMQARGPQHISEQPWVNMLNMTYPAPSTSYHLADIRSKMHEGQGDRLGYSHLPISPTEVENMNNAFGAGMQIGDNRPPEVFREYYQPNHQGQMEPHTTYAGNSPHLAVQSPILQAENFLRPSTGDLSSQRTSNEYLPPSPRLERRWSISKPKMLKKMCTFCHKAFANLARHMSELHTESPKYLCSTPNCKRSINGFTRKNNLDVHMRNGSHTMITE